MYTEQTLRLTTEGARKILEACREHSAGKHVSIAVCDNAGSLMAFEREEGAELNSVNVAQRKARAAAMMRFPTGPKSRLGIDRNTTHCIAMTLVSGTENFVAMEGGLPIFVDGVCIGGVAVSGDGPHDIAHSQAGIDAIGGRTWVEDEKLVFDRK